MGDRHIPIIDEDKLDDIITALQALSAPSGTDVAISPTGMHIVTEDDVQGAISELDSAVDSVNASLTQSEDVLVTGYGIWINGNSTDITIQFRGELPTIANTGSNTVVATIPEGKRPKQSSFGVISFGGNSNKFGLVGVGTDGKITIYNYSGTNNSYAYGQVNYKIY